MSTHGRGGAPGLGFVHAPAALIARSLQLPPPRFGVVVTRGIPVPMPGGARLFADLYAPRGLGAGPAVLIRTPYGRAGETPFGTGLTLAELPARTFAARGYYVLVQGVRGRFESEGVFEPHAHEAADGAATVAWIARQPWYGGRLATWGPSYLGYTQWAAAAAAPGAVHALVPIIASAEPFGVAHPDGAFGLETRLRWGQSLALLDQLHRLGWRGRLAQLAAWRAERRLRQAFDALPLLEADVAAVGRPIPSYRAALTHDRPDDLFWRARDHRAAVAEIDAPAHFVGGWHDYFLRGLLRDYGAMRVAGRRPHLTIGPWHHAHPGPLIAGLREGLRWFDAHLAGRGTAREQPVLLFMGGANAWRALDEFPPPFTAARLFLREGGGLATTTAAGELAPDRYRYDPADPTPALGGALLSFADAGVRDNRPLEARPDVICYTTPALGQDLEAIGPVRLELFARSSLAHTDFFARVCDVTPDGRSLNVCDGLVRVAPGVGERLPDGVLRVELDLGYCCHRFRRSHRVRLQVSSGAHPRWSRNLGTGEPLATGVAMRAADQELYRDGARPSALVLPLV